MAQRILRGAAATLVYDHLDADGELTPATGTLTVAVATVTGTTLLAAGTATTADTTVAGRYTVALPATSTLTLNHLVATWSDSATPTAARRSDHMIVGGFMFSVGEIREFEPSLAKYTTPQIVRARSKVEDEVERICDRAFVPRYRRVTVDGSGDATLITGVSEIRTVRSARVYSSAGSSSYTTLTAGQLAGLVPSPDGQLRRTDSNPWPAGLGTVVLEVEHWFDEPHGDLIEAAMIRCADRLRRPDSSVPERATRYQGDDGFSWDIAPQDEWSTGIPSVDAVYARYSRRRQGDGRDAPASRTLSFDPQFHGLYRGGLR